MDDRIYVKDIRKAKYCLRGTRMLFKRKGYDWSDFVKNGISIEEIKHMDDAMIQRVISMKCKEQ